MANAARFWDDKARENYVGCACWHHSPEEADAKGRRDAAYLKEIIARAPRNPQAPNRLTILDIGGGYGRVAKHLAPSATRYLLTDVSAEMLQRASAHLADVPDVELFLGDGFGLGFAADAEVDFAFACMCFQHIDHEVTIGYLQDLYRVMRPGAWAWFHVPPVQYPGRLEAIGWRDWPGNLHHWAPDQMAEVCLRLGFSVVEMRMDVDPLEVIIAKPAHPRMLHWMAP